MADEWYFTQNDKRQGPVGLAQLKQLATAGGLHATDLVWKEGMAEWDYAATVQGLFPAGTAVPEAPAPPQQRTPKPVPAGMSGGAKIAILGILGACVLLPLCCCGGMMVMSMFGGGGSPTRGEFNFTFQGEGSQEKRIRFNAGAKQKISLRGEVPGGDVELYLSDARGFPVTSDMADRKSERHINITIPRTEEYRIRVQNNHPGPNNCKVTYD